MSHQQHALLNEAAPERRHDEVVRLPPVVDDVLQVDPDLGLHVLEEVLVVLAADAADLADLRKRTLINVASMVNGETPAHMEELTSTGHLSTDISSLFHSLSLTCASSLDPPLTKLAVTAMDSFASRLLRLNPPSTQTFFPEATTMASNSKASAGVPSGENLRKNKFGM